MLHFPEPWLSTNLISSLGSVCWIIALISLTLYAPSVSVKTLST